MIHKFFGIVILLFALNCKSTQQQAKTTNVSMMVISKGNLYGSGQEGIAKQNLIISSQNDWEALLAKVDSVNSISSKFSELIIDFSQYTVIAVFDDVKSSGGHSLELETITYEDKVEVEVIHKAPNGMASSVMTQPYILVKIPKSDLPIVFK